MHEPVVFAVGGCPTGTCRTGVLHSSGHVGSQPSEGSIGSSDSPDSRADASPINVPVAAGGGSGGGPDGTSDSGPVSSSDETSACRVRLERMLQVNVHAGLNGRIDVRTQSWMEGLRARVQERNAP